MRLLKLAALGAIAFAVFSYRDSLNWLGTTEPTGPFPQLGERRSLLRPGRFSMRRPWSEAKGDSMLPPRLRDESSSRRVRILPGPNWNGPLLDDNEQLDDRPRLLPRFNGVEPRWRRQ